MSNEAREFPLGVVLTGATGKMLCRGGFGRFHEFAEFMASGPVWTHELVALGPIIKAELLRQHPDLPTDANVTPETWEAWLTGMEAEHGASLSVTPIIDYARTASPVDTLVDMVGEDKVIVLEATDV